MGLRLADVFAGSWAGVGIEDICFFLAIAHLYSAFFFLIIHNKTLHIFRELASKLDSTFGAKNMLKIKVDLS